MDLALLMLPVHVANKLYRINSKHCNGHLEPYRIGIIAQYAERPHARPEDILAYGIDAA